MTKDVDIDINITINMTIMTTNMNVNVKIYKNIKMNVKNNMKITIPIDRLFSEKGILARGLAHPVVFLGQSTPRALDGVVDGVVKQSEHNDRNSNGAVSGGGGSTEEGRKDANGMQTFFAKVSQSSEFITARRNNASKSEVLRASGHDASKLPGVRKRQSS